MQLRATRSLALGANLANEPRFDTKIPTFAVGAFDNSNVMAFYDLGVRPVNRINLIRPVGKGMVL